MNERGSLEVMSEDPSLAGQFDPALRIAKGMYQEISIQKISQLLRVNGLDQVNAFHAAVEAYFEDTVAPEIISIAQRVKEGS
jgi:hypothetical protein